MNKLILSKRSYEWIDFVSGTVLTEPNGWNVLILMKDDDIPINGFVGLCENAIYEQKRYDLFKIGKKLGIKKLMNMNRTVDDIDDSLIMNLQLHIGLSGIKEVYTKYYDDLYVNTIYNICSQLNTELFLFDCENNESNLLLISKKVELNYDIVERKFQLNNYILDEEIFINNDIEEFYKVG